MVLDELDELKLLLQQSGLKPKKLLGQNFLVNDEVLKKIIEAADLKPRDTILEIGPGLGVLTGKLVGHVGAVVAVEKDDELSAFLKKRFKSAKNLALINQDILLYNLQDLSPGYKVVANIPYYLTSKLIQNFLTSTNKPSLMILMVQKEVGERIIASPGDLSILGISVQLYGSAEIVEEVPKHNFWPVPKVDSVIIKIVPQKKYPDVTDEKFFFRIVKVAFAGKRKQIHNTLSNGFKLPKETILEGLTKAGIAPTARPQDISLDQWADLYKFLFLCYNNSKF